MSVSAVGVGELLWVPIEQLRENSWNPNQMDRFMFERELESIRRFGLINPIITRSADDIIGTYEIIDGEHRWKGARQLHHPEVPIWNLGVVPDHVAKQLTLALNEIRGTHQTEEVAVILRDLLAAESTSDLLALLPYSEQAFQDLLDLPPFEWTDFDRTHPKPVEDAERWVEKVYRMPLAAAAIVDQAIERTMEEHEWKALELICADYLGGKT